MDGLFSVRVAVLDAVGVEIENCGAEHIEIPDGYGCAELWRHLSE
jgi:hypothetical protein